MHTTFKTAKPSDHNSPAAVALWRLQGDKLKGERNLSDEFMVKIRIPDKDRNADSIWLPYESFAECKTTAALSLCSFKGSRWPWVSLGATSDSFIAFLEEKSSLSAFTLKLVDWRMLAKICTRTVFCDNRVRHTVVLCIDIEKKKRKKNQGWLSPLLTSSVLLSCLWKTAEIKLHKTHDWNSFLHRCWRRKNKCLPPLPSLSLITFFLLIWALFQSRDPS